LSRLVRSPDLLLCWKGGRLVVEDLAGKGRTLASPDLVRVLGAFGRPRTPEQAARALAGYERSSVLSGIRRLVGLGLLLPEAEGRQRVSRLATWHGNLASAQYHVAARDIPYVTNTVAGPDDVDTLLLLRAAARHRPARFKRYASAPATALPRAPAAAADGAGELDRVLRARRTTRAFSRRPVALADLAAVVRGTWGRTGWLDAGVLGRLAHKTSPSAGALHPIECYVMAWNVAGLRPGLYHYDVAGDELRRLRSGDLRRTAVRAASGQAWVGRAAFACVMTAVFTRTLWKYRMESAYRVLWLDAGHLGQTFSLLATARGLGPFTTAALQDSAIEALIGLDGVREFPVYLCGAGLPARSS
jgi:SagB-type dehydrogenase family enzyme